PLSILRSPQQGRLVFRGLSALDAIGGDRLCIVALYRSPTLLSRGYENSGRWAHPRTVEREKPARPTASAVPLRGLLGTELRRRSRSGRREQSDVIDRRCFAIVFVTGVLPDQVHDRLRPSDSKEGCTGQSLLGRDNDDRADIEPSIDHCLLQIQILDAEQLD